MFPYQDLDLKCLWCIKHHFLIQTVGWIRLCYIIFSNLKSSIFLAKNSDVGQKFILSIIIVLSKSNISLQIFHAYTELKQV